ncbi:MAG: fibronectin type III domain-containing protein [Acidobacteriota bacterium]|nr:fibronectin type III domain-containing protein [Acidobacteriota bacterium]
MSARCLRTAIVLAVVALLVSDRAWAQSQRIYAAKGSTLAELDSNPAYLGQVRRAWTLPGAPGPTPLSMTVAGAGRYLVWSLFETLSVFDTVTGALTTHALEPSVVDIGIVGVSDEGDEVVLSAFEGGGAFRLVVWSASAGVVRSVPMACPRAFAYAPAVSQVMVLRMATCVFGPPSAQWIDVVDLRDGTIRERAFDVPFSTKQGIATNAAGTRLWVVSVAGYGGPAGYGAFDVRTGALLAVNGEVQAERRNRFATPKLALDDARNLLLSVTTDGLAALDGDTLRLVGRADAPAYRLDERTLPPGYEATFSYEVLSHPDAAAVFAYEASGMTSSYHGGPCVQSALVALDPRTGLRLATKDLAQVAGQPLCFVQFAMAVAPARPQGFQAAVTGLQVALSWEPPPRTTHYELEVGSAPGLRNLGVFTPGTNPFVVSDVPPGVYYVRLRALNYAGKGAYTDDLAIVVR